MSRSQDDGTLSPRRNATFRIFKEPRRGRILFHVQILSRDGKIIRRTECALDLPDDLDEDMKALVEASLESGARRAAIDWIRKNA